MKVGNVDFEKLCTGPKQHFPGDPFNNSFQECDKEESEI